MKKTTAFIILFFLTFGLYSQSPKKIIKKLGADPVFFLDSVNILRSEMLNINPTDVASVTVYRGKEATDLIGENGKDGVIYIFTKSYAKNSYWNYFRSKSKHYSDSLPTPESDSTVQYILNKRILTTNFEGDLMSIDDSIFKELIIIDKKTLEKEYNIFNKAFGIVIKSDKPDNLYHAKKKF